MIRRGIILAAMAVYLVIIIVGFTNPHKSLGAGDGQTTKKSTDANSKLNDSTAPRNEAFAALLPFRSISMQIQRVDWIDKYIKNIDEIAEQGADTVLFVVDCRMENVHSVKIYLDMRHTPTIPQLAELIDHARERKLRVILMPIVLLDYVSGDEWRGKIDPQSWEEWFDSYSQIMTHFATVAQDHHVDVLVVGSELVSTEKHHEWSRIISDVRGTFKGMLTYSSNWDHYTSVPFWDELDMIGMNDYWTFGSKSEPQPKVEQIVARWHEIQRDLLAFVEQHHKPLLFTEVGWFSQANVAYEPWDYTKAGEPVDTDLQRRLYEGFFTAWMTSDSGHPPCEHLAGFSIWDWPPEDKDNLDIRRGYTPKGKPAEKVLRDWLGKPTWTVQ